MPEVTMRENKERVSLTLKVSRADNSAIVAVEQSDSCRYGQDSNHCSHTLVGITRFVTNITDSKGRLA
jgi:hypothetical protein